MLVKTLLVPGHCVHAAIRPDNGTVRLSLCQPIGYIAECIAYRALRATRGANPKRLTCAPSATGVKLGRKMMRLLAPREQSQAARKHVVQCATIVGFDGQLGKPHSAGI